MSFSRRSSAFLSMLAATAVLGLTTLLTTLPGSAETPGSGAQAAQVATQNSQPEAVEAVRAAVASEMEANRADKSVWMYRDHDKTPEKDAVYNTIETPKGMLRRMIELNGKPLTGSAEQAETQRIEQYVHEAGLQQRARKNAAHDDAQAAELLKMLPEAFIWTVESKTPELITLDYSPNPGFSPPDMQARVMSAMAGQMIVARDGDRIRTLRGKLATEVLIGWGILGKLNQGGTFDVERRMVGDGHWEITETDVHIGGHALVFKTIGQQEDEVKTDWRPSSAQTLEQAAAILGAGK